MNVLFVLFTVIKLSNAVEYTMQFDNYKPINVIEKLDAGDSIKVTYKDAETFVVIIDSPKFYLDVQLSSNKREFHSTEPAVYAVGNSGGLRYTALEKGTHKFVVWQFSSARCQYLIAKGKQLYNNKIAITKTDWGFIQTDSSVPMNVKSNQLKDYQTVFIYNSPTDIKTINKAYGGFDLNVNVPVVIQSPNKVGIEVEISSNGNEKYNYGEFSENDLKVEAVPFYFTSENVKKNMKDGYYDPEQPSQQETNGDNNEVDKETSNEADNGANGDEKPKDDGLTAGEKAGIAVGSVGGVGAISGVIGAVVHAIKKKNNSEDQGNEMNVEANADAKADAKAQANAEIKNTNNVSNDSNNNNNQSTTVKICCNIC